ncbi:MAG: hypothetical protein OEW05_09970, partial [Candidatus Aminicenantes bacterium]|nr:hypothetical protein [Candidatus Aminicenantes bacterium]
QLTETELAEAPKWEEFLKTAEIVDQEQRRGRGAVTNPWVLTLKKDDVVRRAAWKNPDGPLKGYIDRWRYEIAAYRMDRLLGLNMTPPTVERRFRGDRGSCQLWIEDCITLLQKTEEKIPLPSIKILPYNRAVYLQRAFDNLIANEDRHQQNLLYTKDWRTIFIDHSRSFRTSKKFTRDLIYTARHSEGPKLMKELPRTFIEKLKALDAVSIRAAVGEYLDDTEIGAILIRRDLILAEIDKLVKESGEENVIY